jgi:hypothetical protein
MTAKQRKYFGPKKERTVAKKRRRRSRKSTAIVRRRRGTIVRRRRSRRRHGGGGGGGLLPNKHELIQLAATGVYGFLETKAKADANFLLNKVPKLVPQLGYAGNVALIARVANKFLFRNKYLALLGNAAAHAFMYQVGREGGLPKDTNVFAISGDEDEHFLGDGYLEDDELGALAAEGSVGHGPIHYDDAPEVHTVQGVPYMEPNPGT